MIRRKIAEFEAEFGSGSAAVDLAAGALALLFLGCDLVGLLIFADVLVGARI